MNLIFRAIFKFIIITLLIIGGGSIAFSTFFSDEIEKTLIGRIQENLVSPLIFESVEFTVYEKFPNASIKIKNLLILEAEESNYDTIIFTELAYIELSLKDLIQKHYVLKNIIVTDGKINVKYNDTNTPNFLIFKKQNNVSKPLLINQVTILNTELNIKKSVPIMNLKWDLKRSIILIEKQKFTFDIDGFSNKLLVGATDFMNRKEFDFFAQTLIKKDTLNIFESNLKLNNTYLNIEGDIKLGNILNLKIEGENQSIEQIIKNLPKKIQDFCSPFNTNGKISFNSSLKGLLDNKNNPFFSMDYKILDGYFKLKKTSFELTDIKMEGQVDNGENRNFNTTKITSNLFKGTTKNGYVDGTFTLSNLNKFFLNTQFKSTWDLAEVNKYFKTSPFIELNGKLFIITNYLGNISFDERFRKKFLDASHKSDIKLKNIEFFYKKSPLKFTFKSADIKLEDHKMLIANLQSTISETDYKFNGKVINFISHLFNNSKRIYINGNIQSIYTNFSEILTLGSLSSNMKSKNIMPHWIDANVYLDIKKLSHKNFISSNLSGNLLFKKGTLNGNNLKARSLNGEISCKFSLTEPIYNHLKLISNIELKDINIRNSFEAFNNYGQKTITKNQLKGIGNAKVEIESYWKPNYVLDTKKLKINSDLVIEKGELIDYKPLENLSSYVSLEELRHVKFSKLENTINVSNEIITIPTMEINSSALSLVLSGTHTFNQEINYDLKLILSELLSSTFRKKNTNITKFGEEKKDGKIFNTVYFKMTGTTENPKIALNPMRFMQDVNTNVKKETEKLITIIKEDILQSETKGEEEEEGQEIEIEWEPKL